MLITTNVLARGIDIDQVNVVINYDLPLKWEVPPGSFGGRPEVTGPDTETYLHRIGMCVCPVCVCAWRAQVYNRDLPPSHRYFCVCVFVCVCPLVQASGVTIVYTQRIRILRMGGRVSGWVFGGRGLLRT